MKKSIFTLAAIALLFASCKEVTQATEEAQTVVDSVEAVNAEAETLVKTVDSVSTEVLETTEVAPVAQ